MNKRTKGMLGLVTAIFGVGTWILALIESKVHFWDAYTLSCAAVITVGGLIWFSHRNDQN